MEKLKVITVMGTRPEIIRLSRVLQRLDLECDHKIVHTGQNYDYELNQIFFDDLGLRRPDYFLGIGNSETNAIKTIGNIFISLDDILEIENPEAFLVLGDTNSCLAAIVAKRRKIPIFHMEAGNRCFDSRVPEEINRKIVDHVADVNLTYSDISREYLLNEGMDPSLIIKTGSPMYEVLDYYGKRIENSVILKSLGLVRNKYFVVSVHREENLDLSDLFDSFVFSLNSIASDYKIPIILSTHPRTAKKIEDRKITLHELVRVMRPFNFTDYVKLQINAKAVLSDSGTISEESSILNFPALNLREAHERPEAMEEASVVMTGLQYKRISQSLAVISKQGRGANRSLNIVKDYSHNNVSQKVVRIIHSYTDYVNRVVWRK